MAQQEARYQYFWLKIVKAPDSAASGKAALENPDLDMLTSLKPQHQYIIPKTATSITLGGQTVKAVLNVRAEMDLEEARRQGLGVEFYPMDGPMSRAEALKWIKGPGASWARGGLCVLCSVSVEPAGA